MSRRFVLHLPAALLLALLALAGPTAGEVGAERSGGAGVIVSLDGAISPRRLPRDRPAPVSLTLAGSVSATAGAQPPQLSRIEVAFGSRGGLDTAGLPSCPRKRLRDATGPQALARCGNALVGRGAIATEVPLNPEQPVLADAKVLAFNGRSKGRPAVWVHAYSASPPVSFVLPFFLHRPSGGVYDVVLRAPVAAALGRWPRLRSFRMTLGRNYRVGGVVHSYLSARCPLPPRFHVGYFPLAHATYSFAPRPTLSTTILRGCSVRE